jgi:hypothetical protein
MAIGGPPFSDLARGDKSTKGDAHATDRIHRPKGYLSTDTDAARLLEQIDRTWPARMEDDDAPTKHRSRNRSLNDRPKPLDAR